MVSLDGLEGVQLPQVPRRIPVLSHGREPPFRALDGVDLAVHEGVRDLGQLGGQLVIETPRVLPVPGERRLGQVLYIARMLRAVHAVAHGRAPFAIKGRVAGVCAPVRPAFYVSSAMSSPHSASHQAARLTRWHRSTSASKQHRTSRSAPRCRAMFSSDLAILAAPYLLSRPR